MAPSPFLGLPQEIRDLIFEYAVEEDRFNADFVRMMPNYRTKRIAISNNHRWAWECHHTAQAPFPEYLCLMMCNRQLKYEIEEFLKRPEQGPAKMIMLLEYPHMWPTWTKLSEPPRRIKTLDLLIKVDSMYHPAYISRGSQNAILTAVSDTLKRYIYRGPHLSRPSSLKEPLHLETVRITLAPPMPWAQMEEVYGISTEQLETLFTGFRALLMRFCRSGLPYELIDSFEIRMDGGKWDRIPVTSNIWDEQDFVFFQYGGFNWEGSMGAIDTTSYEPDLIAW